MRRTLGGVCLLACACLVWIAPASAGGGGGSPQDSGVYDQYTEQIPTAGGSHGTNSGGGGTTGSTGGDAIVLPANLKHDGGKDAKKLRDVATSSRYGAPDVIVALPESSTNSPAALSSAVNAVGEGSGGRMVGLFIALLAITAVALGIAAARRRG